jgi:hypothetical protein
MPFVSTCLKSLFYSFEQLAFPVVFLHAWKLLLRNSERILISKDVDLAASAFR